MSEATFTAMQKQPAGRAHIDLVITIAFYSAVVRILATLEIDVEDSYKRYWSSTRSQAK